MTAYIHPRFSLGKTIPFHLIPRVLYNHILIITKTTTATTKNITTTNVVIIIITIRTDLIKNHHLATTTTWLWQCKIELGDQGEVLCSAVLVKTRVCGVCSVSRVHKTSLRSILFWICPTTSINTVTVIVTITTSTTTIISIIITTTIVIIINIRTRLFAAQCRKMSIQSFFLFIPLLLPRARMYFMLRLCNCQRVFYMLYRLLSHFLLTYHES